MAVSIAIWSQDLEPNKRNVYTVENDVRISGASLAADIADPNGRTVVEVVINIPEDYDFDEDTDVNPDERPPMHKFVLCALTAGKVEQQPLDLVLPEGEEIEFVVKGKNPVHLYGNYIQQTPNEDEDDDDDDEDEDEFDLGGLPSDLELEADEEAGDSSRFEEIQDAPASVKTGKRAREDEEMADVATATAADTSATTSKKDKKRAKKLKNEAGKAAPAPATASATETTTTVTTTTTSSPNKDKKDKPVEKKEAAKPAEKKEAGKKDGEKKKKSEPKTLPGGVVIEDKTVGSGPAAKAGKKVGMRYIGRLKNGKVFDSNTKGKPFFFTLGKGDVIKGWDEGISGMLVGGERVLTIPAAKAYGKRGAPPDIPPNSDLIFEVKLVEVK
ncbi:peptidyl-prolyl cis-trans isomerase [Rhizoctonia solani 123E]|uniref:FK506-binding protein n=1 Tax=Rhizoctonia solani 123E TaxID=1423351 RepID=A0A074S1T8_9AGAM|nr:peptidyl-prolyl cis-trans isomerase [Rhizoctonia solani 123E]